MVNLGIFTRWTAAFVCVCLGGMLMGDRSAAAQMHGRFVVFNRTQMVGNDLARVEALEQYYGVRLQNGYYWYDSVSGLVGVEGGPAFGVIAPGLPLGGPLPADCSGRGTGVFVNGREIHWRELVLATKYWGYVPRGHYWMLSDGRYGDANGRMLGQLQPPEPYPNAITPGGKCVNATGVSLLVPSMGVYGVLPD
jgi:hypothetical protein